MEVHRGTRGYTVIHGTSLSEQPNTRGYTVIHGARASPHVSTKSGFKPNFQQQLHTRSPRVRMPRPVKQLYMGIRWGLVAGSVLLSLSLVVAFEHILAPSN